MPNRRAIEPQSGSTANASTINEYCVPGILCGILSRNSAFNPFTVPVLPVYPILKMMDAPVSPAAQPVMRQYPPPRSTVSSSSSAIILPAVGPWGCP